MNHLERFFAVMAYQPVDRVPNWEAGVWPQTAERWEREGLDPSTMHWHWFPGEATIGLDPREFIAFSREMIPPFDEKILDEDEKTITFIDAQGRTRRGLKAGSIGGARMSMDQYIEHPVRSMSDWLAIKRRLDPIDQKRYEPYWQVFRVEGWQKRHYPLIFGPNTATPGFYWQARELMGTEGLSFAWYDQPALVHDIMEHIAYFLIEAARPVLAQTTVDYICLAEDLAMKTAPLLSPATFREFIFPRLRRVIDFFKSNGVRYICVDTDGNPEVLIPMMLDAGVDALWPLERTANQDPVRLRQVFGPSLRLWGGVDKRVLTQGSAAIDEHLRTLQPLIEQGGFIPTVDHTVPPDVSWSNFQHYMASKDKLLRGEL
ncbi:MAG: uroporphyrinogen decarboxylase family protein [Chloroflexota bacterium]|nr:uroporphyrinogen decarboxylase family protein [Chloroflexota bacterium]